MKIVLTSLMVDDQEKGPAFLYREARLPEEGRHLDGAVPVAHRHLA